MSVRAVAAAALLALAACGPGEKSKPAAPVGPGAPKSEAPALAPGEARVEVRDGRVTIVCHDAPRGLVIEKLAREGSFQLTGELDATPTSLDLESVAMDQALPALLKGASYRAQWRFDKDQDRHLLTRLEMGEVTGAAQAVHKPKIGEALRERIRALRDKQQPTEKQKAEAAARREEHARTQADAMEELRSSNPDMRIEAAGDIEPEGPALASLMEVLSGDADPRVRAKVAEQLADADGCVASMGLVTATADADPTVRCAAWHSLEMSCDESMLPSMQPRCANEPDAKVRECCTGTLEMCQ